jgi:hypothetical protein
MKFFVKVAKKLALCVKLELLSFKIYAKLPMMPSFL